MENKKRMPATVLAQMEVFDYLKEKVGERKTRTEAYCDLLDKAMAGFVSSYLRRQDYELRPCQCHVTVSDLAVEWRWHRATVRSFLDTLESFGLLTRIRLPKSMVITMAVQSGQPAPADDVQSVSGLAAQLREVLSDWVVGYADSSATGSACGQLVRSAMTASGVRVDPDKASKDDDPLAVGIHATAMGCIALAAMQRVLRRSRFDDRLEFMDFFRLDLGGEWSSLIETSKVLAGLILDAEADGTTTEPDATQEGLKSFRKSFLALAAHVLEEAD